jgi:hypothetical protein
MKMIFKGDGLNGRGGNEFIGQKKRGGVTHLF